MKHKTAELTGSLLDAAVACALGDRRYPTPAFSTDWGIGAPIVEQERVTLHISSGRSLAYVAAEFMSDEVTNYTSGGDGETPLIAAMRAFVAAKIGAEVDELLLSSRVCLTPEN